jgi:hypothetical protein
LTWRRDFRSCFEGKKANSPDCPKIFRVKLEAKGAREGEDRARRGRKIEKKDI